MSKIKIGIVGCGGIANQKRMPAMKLNGGLCEIIAVCDVVPERAKSGH